jgi:uncharacterized protein (TIGR00296 family)
LGFELNIEEGRFLVELARNGVKEFLKTQKHIQPPKNTPKKLFEHCGVFVTINRLENGEQKLRGCIGYPYPTNQLVEAVIDSAINAATRDPRFPPLSVEELGKVVFEVSVLAPPELIETNNPKEYVSKFKVGEHGLIIEKGPFKGLLLPQVPVEWNWCEEEFLCQCCMKAGLPPDTWLTNGVRIYKFKGIIFEEESPQGNVKRRTLN